MSKVKISVQGGNEVEIDCLDSVESLKKNIHQQMENLRFLWVQNNGSHIIIPARKITMIEISE